MGKKFFQGLMVCLIFLLICSAQTGFAKDMGPIKIGHLSPLSGVAAQIGKDAKDGAETALEEINYTMAGRKVEMVYLDTEALPDKALTQARKLVEMDKVDVIIGPLSTASVLAVQPYVDAKKIPTLGMASEDDLTQRKIPKYMMRISWGTSQASHALGEYAYKVLGYRKVAFLGADYGFGWQTIGGFQAVFEKLGGKVITKIWVPMMATDLSPYIPQIPKDVDAVVILTAGKAAIQFLKQYREAGYTLPVIGLGTATDESVLPAMGDEALGVITALHYSAALDTPANKDFSKKFKAKSGKIPSYYAEEYYAAIRWIAKAVEALKGDVSDKKKFMEALKTVKFDMPRGPMKLDKYGSPIQNIYIRKVERVNGQLQNTVIYTYPNVSQFWTFNPQEFLKKPVYSRDYPPLKK